MIRYISICIAYIISHMIRIGMYRITSIYISVCPNHMQYDICDTYRYISDKWMCQGRSDEGVRVAGCVSLLRGRTSQHGPVLVSMDEAHACTSRCSF